MPVVWLLVLALLPSAAAHARESFATRPAVQKDPADATSPPSNSLEWLDKGTSIYHQSHHLKRARKYWRRHKFGRAERAFKKALAQQLTPEMREKVDFLYARMLVDAGQYRQAAARLAALPGTVPELKDWAHYYAGESFYELRQFTKAAHHYGAVSAACPRHRRASRRACAALYQAGDEVGFEQCRQTYAAAHGDDATLLLFRARLLVKLDQHAQAAALVNQIRTDFPGSWAAGEIDGLRRQLKKKGLKEELKLTGPQILTRGQGFMARHQYSSALRLFEKLVDRQPRKSELWCRALGLTAVAWARKREQTRSMPFFDRFVDDCEPYFDPPTIYRGVDAARKAGKSDLTEKFTAALLKHFSDSTLCDDALLFLARVFDRQGETDRMNQTIDRLFATYSAGDMAPDVAWMRVFALYRDGKYQEAFDQAAHYAKLLPARADYRSDGRLLYWMGRIRQRQKKGKDARPFFRQVLREYPYTWYGLLAYLRLEDHKSGAGDEALEAARTASPPTLPTLDDVLGRVPGWQVNLDRALLFLSLELTREAQAELKLALAGMDEEEDPAKRLLAAHLFHRAAMYPESHHTLRRRVPEFHYAYPRDDDDRWWRTAYPLPFETLVKKSSRKESIPFSLIVAIMREESGFDPRIESYAHAIGLMQLLQKTASWIGGRKVSTRHLRIPKKNIPLGTKYLRYLWDKFGHPVLVVAGYNAGPGGVLKTFKRTSNRHVDEFVEHIPYDQTRRYTKRVLGSAWTYQVLYGDQAGTVPFKLKHPRYKKKKKKKKKKKP